MIIVENIGFVTNNGTVLREYVINIYEDDKRIAHLGHEFASLSFDILNEKLNEGDIFGIRIVDKKGNILEESIGIFKKVEGGRIIYE